MSPQNHDVFMSYAREDLAAVRSLVTFMEAEGLRVFWDRQIQPGQAWSDVLETALSDARVVVVVWSAASVKSAWVKAEATEAMSRGKLVPLRIDSATIPMPFGQVQTADVAAHRPLSEQGVSITSAIAAQAAGIAAVPPARAAPSGAAASTRTSHVVDWRHAFLSMEGRLSRREYWICYLMLTVLTALCTVLVDSMAGTFLKETTLDIKSKSAATVYVLTLYPRVAIFLKRLHDFGWSGWWTLPAAIIALTSTTTFPYIASNVPGERHAAWLFLVLLWSAFIYVGARNSSPGVNKFGPPSDRH
jgi:uncharacterized membrane protein YhaH (DUF805 family)